MYKLGLCKTYISIIDDMTQLYRYISTSFPWLIYNRLQYCMEENYGSSSALSGGIKVDMN